MSMYTRKLTSRKLRFESLEKRALLAAAITPLEPETSDGDAPALIAPMMMSDGLTHQDPSSSQYVANHHDPYLPDFSQFPATAGRNVFHSTVDGDWQTVFAAAGPADVVVVDHAIHFDGAADVHSIVIRDGGTLQFDVAGNQSLRVVNLQVLEGGTLEIGTAAAPHRGKAEIVFKDVPFDFAIDPGQYGNGLVALGTVTMHGRTLQQTFTTLDGEILAGADAVAVDGDLTGWSAGDRLLIPDSRQLFYTAHVPTKLDRYDSPTVATIESGRLRLQQSMQYDHLGARNAAGELVFSPHIANLSRNIVLRSENPAGVRGHTMLMGRAEIDIRYVEFRDMGRTTNAEVNNTLFHDGGHAYQIGTNQASRYSIHLHHLIGPRDAPAGMPQYTILGNAVHSSVSNLKWGITIHGSHYGLVDQNVVYNFAGAGIVTEVGSESYNTISNNFVSRISGIGGRGKFSVGREGDGIWLKRPNNYVDGNVVTGAQRAAYGIYGGDNGRMPAERIPAFQGADTHLGECVLLNPDQMHLLSFNDNVGYASMNGLDLWYLGFATYYDPSSLAVATTEVNDLSLWNINHTAVFGEQANNVTFRRLTVIGSRAAAESYNYPTGFSVLRAKDVQILDSVIENMRNGINAPVRIDRLDVSLKFGDVKPFLIKNTRLSNDVNVIVGTPAEDASGRAPAKHIVIDNVIFGTKSIFTSAGSSTDIRMTYASGRFANVIQDDVVEVLNYNGTTGEDFRAYYPQQAPSYVVPMTGSAISTAPISPLGAPVAGLTNAQAWQQYGIAVAGAVAPGEPDSDYRLSYPSIAGLVFPLVRGNIRPQILAVAPDTGTRGDAVTAANRVVLKGVAAAFTTVDLYRDGVRAGQATANANGLWAVDFTSAALTDGTYRFTVAPSGQQPTEQLFDVQVLSTAPRLSGESVAVSEDTASGAIVTTINSDSDVVFSIVSGDPEAIFAIDAASGNVLLRKGTSLGSRIGTKLVLTVRAVNLAGLATDLELTIEIIPRPPGYWVTQLGYQSLGSLTAAEIAFVTPQQIGSIPDAYWFGTIRAEVRATLRADQLAELQVWRSGMLPLLTQQQQLGLSLQQYQSLGQTEFHYVPVERINWLTAAQFAAISDKLWFSRIPSAVRAAIEPERLAQLRLELSGMYQLLTAQQRLELPESAYQRLRYQDFSGVPTSRISSLSETQVAAIPDRYWFAAIPAESRAQFTQSQVRQLNLSIVGIPPLLTAQQIGWISDVQLAQVKYQDFNVLSAEQVVQLSRAQLTSIPDSWWFNRISTAGRTALQERGIYWSVGGLVFPS